jgi:hypothetical protein
MQDGRQHVFNDVSVWRNGNWLSPTPATAPWSARSDAGGVVVCAGSPSSSSRARFALVLGGQERLIPSADNNWMGSRVLNDVWLMHVADEDEKNDDSTDAQTGNIPSVSWMRLTSAAPWSGRSAFGLVHWRNRVIIMSGWVSSPQADVWSMDVDEKFCTAAAAAFASFPPGHGETNASAPIAPATSWTAHVPGEWEARFSFVAAVVNDALFVTGGRPFRGPADYFNDLWRLDGPSLDGPWHQITAAPAPFAGGYRSAFAVWPLLRISSSASPSSVSVREATEQSLVLLGGLTDTTDGNERGQGIFMLNSTSGIWTELLPADTVPRFGSKRMGASLVATATQLLLFGGVVRVRQGNDAWWELRDDVWAAHAMQSNSSTEEGAVAPDADSSSTAEAAASSSSADDAVLSSSTASSSSSSSSSSTAEADLSSSSTLAADAEPVPDESSSGSNITGSAGSTNGSAANDTSGSSSSSAAARWWSDSGPTFVVALVLAALLLWLGVANWRYQRSQAKRQLLPASDPSGAGVVVVSAATSAADDDGTGGGRLGTDAASPGFDGRPPPSVLQSGQPARSKRAPGQPRFNIGRRSGEGAYAQLTPQGVQLQQLPHHADTQLDVIEDL